MLPRVTPTSSGLQHAVLSLMSTFSLLGICLCNQLLIGMKHHQNRKCPLQSLSMDVWGSLVPKTCLQVACLWLLNILSAVCSLKLIVLIVCWYLANRQCLWLTACIFLNLSDLHVSFLRFVCTCSQELLFFSLLALSNLQLSLLLRMSSKLGAQLGLLLWY